MNKVDIEAEPDRRNRKCEQLLKGAHKVFMERGFEGASVDEIARAAGTSKATLYSYFPDKRQMFEAVIQAECPRQGEMFCGGVDENSPAEQVLRNIALTLATRMLSPPSQSMFRICIAEAGRFPELGQAFYRAAPERFRGQLVEYLQNAVTKGELAIVSAEMAADQFIGLAKARLFMRTLLGAGSQPTTAEIAEVAEEAVRTFLARYGAKPA